jgi:hypothetical protein
MGDFCLHNSNTGRSSSVRAVHLHADAVQSILHWLDFAELALAVQVCRSWRDVACNQQRKWSVGGVLRLNPSRLPLLVASPLAYRVSSFEPLREWEQPFTMDHLARLAQLPALTCLWIQLDARSLAQLMQGEGGAGTVVELAMREATRSGSQPLPWPSHRSLSVRVDDNIDAYTNTTIVHLSARDPDAISAISLQCKSNAVRFVHPASSGKSTA